MAGRRVKEKEQPAATDSAESGAAPASSADDEFEILEVVGINETEPRAEVAPTHESEHAAASSHGAGHEPSESASEELQATLKEKEHYHDLWLRLQAEFDNYKKRAEREAERLRAQGAADLAARLLPILDNLERAIGSGAGDDPLRRGVELIQKQWLDLLVKEGLRPIPTVGRRFDPQLHEAVEVVDADGTEEGIILEEMQKGYMFKDRLVRPALVKVASGRGTQTALPRAAAG